MSGKRRLCGAFDVRVLCKSVQDGGICESKKPRPNGSGRKVARTPNITAGGTHGRREPGDVLNDTFVKAEGFRSSGNGAYGERAAIPADYRLHDHDHDPVLH